MTLPKGRDEDIIPAIVIEITDGSSHPVQGDSQPCFAGYIRERSVVIVAIKASEWKRRRERARGSHFR